MLENLKNLIAGWRKFLSQSVSNWYKAHFKTECSLCDTPTLLKDIKNFKFLRRSLQLCPDCSNDPEKRNKFLYSCDMCKNIFPDGSLTEFRDNILCNTCLNKRAFHCPECHEWVSWIRKFVTQSTVEICESCAGKLNLHDPLLSEQAKAFLEKCHREAIKMRQTGNDEESLCRTLQKISFRECARCGKSIAFGENIFLDSSQKAYCKLCAADLGLMNYYAPTVSACDSCGKKVSVNLLTLFENSLLCSKCLDTYFPLCPICRTRITVGNSFHSTYLLEYCNPCGKKFGLTRYTPPANITETTQKSSGRKRQKKKSEKPVEFWAELVPSPNEIPPGMSDAEILRMMQGGKRTSWSTILSEPPPAPPPKKQSFSTNNYYHPDFDDNEEDDFVLDGIGGLDGKHDV